MPLGIKDRLLANQNASKNALSDKLTIREVNLLSRKVVKHFEICAGRLLTECFLRVITEEQEVIGQDVLLEDLLQLHTKNQ